MQKKKTNRFCPLGGCLFLPNPCDSLRLAKYLSAENKSKRSKRDFPHLRYQLRGLVVLLFIASANWTMFFFRPLLVKRGDFGEASHLAFGVKRVPSEMAKNLSTLKVWKSRTWRLKNPKR